MTHKAFSTIQRRLGVIEGAIFDPAKSVSCGILDAIEVIDATLEKEVLTDGGNDPVRHGRWRESGPLLECQSCGEIYSRLGGNAGTLWNYCPNCGARMDGAE